MCLSISSSMSLLTYGTFKVPNQRINKCGNKTHLKKNRYEHFYWSSVICNGYLAQEKTPRLVFIHVESSTEIIWHYTKWYTETIAVTLCWCISGCKNRGISNDFKSISNYNANNLHRYILPQNVYSLSQT